MTEDEQYRDAVTGQYVTEEYAEENPDTTVAETMPDSYEERWVKYDDEGRMQVMVVSFQNNTVMFPEALARDLMLFAGWAPEVPTGEETSE